MFKCLALLCFIGGCAAPIPVDPRPETPDCSPPVVNGFKLRFCGQDFDAEREICIYEGQGQRVGLVREDCKKWAVIGVQPLDEPEEELEL